MTRTLPPEKIALPEVKSVKSSKLNAPIGDIHVLEGFNVRVELTNLDDLIASIEANGFYPDKPISVYSSKDGYIVVDGHRRLAAVTAINDRSLDGPIITSLPVVVKPTATSLAELHIAQIQSANSEPLTMFEKGIAVRRIMADGMTKDEVARAFGVTTKTIDNYIAVASAPKPAVNLLLDGKVKETHVLRALGKPDPVKVLQAMVKSATKDGRKAAKASDAKPKTPTDAPPPETPAVALESMAPIWSDVLHEIPIDAHQALGPVLRAVAAYIRAQVPHDSGEDDTAFKGGTIEIRVVLNDDTAPTDDIPPELMHAIGDNEL